MKKRKAAIQTIFIVLSLVMWVGVTFAVSNNYHSLYGMRKKAGTVLDLEGFSLKDVPIESVLSGEWEFFYNKWIVSEGYSGEPDCIIELPGRWTGMTVNGQRLGRSGYASYRMTIINPEIGTELCFGVYDFPIAYKAYINGELNRVSGVNSMLPGESAASGVIDGEYPYIVKDGSPLEIVVELSYNNYGGLFAPVWLTDTARIDYAVGNFMTIFVYLSAGIMTAFLVFSIIINFGLYRKRRIISPILLIVSLFFHLMCTNEMTRFFAPFLPPYNFAVVFEMCFVTGILVMLIFTAYLLQLKIIDLKRFQKIFYAVVFTVCAAGYYLLLGTSYQIYPIAAGLLCYSFIFYKLLLSRQSKNKDALPSILVLYVISGLLILETVNNLGYLVYSLTVGVSMMLVLIFAIFIVSFYIKIKNSTEKALKSAEYEIEINKVKHQVLKSQIKPHFVFNTLSSIQNLYKRDPEAGDGALSRFAKHLRQNIEADVKDLIPFSDEIQNIMNYIELENLRADKNITLLLNIEYQDFEVPILSLQPFVENSIKYAGLESIKDGYIEITAKSGSNAIIVGVSDNGKGFDTRAVKQNSLGMKNCSQRLKYLLDAETEIISGIGEGTTVRIIIPRGSENEDNSN